MLSKSPNTGFISNDVYTIQNSSKHLENLKSRIPWQKYKNSKRLVCSLGVSYSYSGHTTIGHSFDLYPPLKKLIDSINSVLGTNYNSALLNYEVFHLNLNNIPLHFLKKEFLDYV